MAEVVDQLRKLEERLETKLTGRHRVAATGLSRAPISPFPPNGDAASRWFAQDQRLSSADTSGFKDRETLAFQWMERVSNFCPSQRLTGNLGSSR